MKKGLRELGSEHGAVGTEARVKFAGCHKKMEIVILINKLVNAEEEKGVIGKKVGEGKGRISWT